MQPQEKVQNFPASQDWHLLSWVEAELLFHCRKKTCISQWAYWSCWGPGGEQVGCWAPENSLGSSRDGWKAGWAEGARFKLRVKRSQEIGHGSCGAQVPVLETTRRQQAHNRSIRKGWEDSDPEFPSSPAVSTWCPNMTGHGIRTYSESGSNTRQALS